MLNSGETNDDLFDADGNVINNCTTGQVPSVTGFTVTDDGDLSRSRVRPESWSAKKDIGLLPGVVNP